MRTTPGDDHVRWLLDALREGAARRDPFEIERHIDVPPPSAVALGATLHAISGGPHAVVSPADAVVARGDVEIRYRAADGSARRVRVPQSADGRLGMPAFD